jgi:hypothetical protein
LNKSFSLIVPSGGGENLNKKKVTIIFLMLIFSITAFNIQNVFSQVAWYSVKVSAYGTNLIENNLGGASLEFTVADPPTGVDVSNTMCGVLSDNDQNYSVNLNPGENIIVTYTGNAVVDRISLVDGPDSGYYIIEYEGEAGWLYVNGAQIPEFSPILITPLFMVTTLLAIVYSRKHRS